MRYGVGYLAVILVAVAWSIEAIVVQRHRLEPDHSRGSLLDVDARRFLELDCQRRARALGAGARDGADGDARHARRACVLSIPVAWLGAANITPFGKTSYAIGRFLMTMSRSVHEIVWGLIFVSAVGLGALAGVLAMAVRSIGFISKTIAEAIEDVDPKPLEAIRAAGGTKFQILWFAILPQIIPVFVGNMIFEWDINIRRSTIMGLVGAGGLGLRAVPADGDVELRRHRRRDPRGARAHHPRRSRLALCTQSRHLSWPEASPPAGAAPRRRRRGPPPTSPRPGAGSAIRRACTSTRALLGSLAFLAFSLEYLNIDLERLPGMLGRMGEMLGRRYFPPNVDHMLNAEYWHSVVETLQMSYLATVLGLATAVPLAWFAAYQRDAQPALRLPGRRASSSWRCRSVHEMIWTILLVTMLGFGMLPGALALTLFCIGFAGKLFSEAIEAIRPGPGRGDPRDRRQHAAGLRLRGAAAGARRLDRHLDLHLGRGLPRRHRGRLLRRRRHGLVPARERAARRLEGRGRDPALDHLSSSSCPSCSRPGCASASPRPSPEPPPNSTRNRQ